MALRLSAAALSLGIAVTVGVQAWPSVHREPAVQDERAAQRPPAVHALLINGGDQPQVSSPGDFQNLQAMVDLLRRRGLPLSRMHIFSADGEEDAADLATEEPNPPDFWLIEGTALGGQFTARVELTSTRWGGVGLRPARRAGLDEWFERARREILPGDRLFIFITGAGSDESDAGVPAIALRQERMTLREFQALLSRLPQGVQVVMLMSQCGSGGFADLMFDGGAGEPSGNVCGFFSAAAGEKSDGCQEEGTDGRRAGHAFEFVDALGRRSTLADAHHDVLTSDDTVDSPLRTSDAYLAHVLAQEASARRMDVATFADAVLGQAPPDSAAPQADLVLLERISSGFGTPAARGLTELQSRSQEYAALAEQLRASADKWNVLLVEMKEWLLQEFLKSRPAWLKRLEEAAGPETAPSERRSLLPPLLTDLAAFLRQHDDVRTSLEKYRDFAVRGAEAAERVDVRTAAVDRMETILVSMAGRILLDQADARGEAGDPAAKGLAAQREALRRLERCEAFAPGEMGERGGSPPGPRRGFPPASADLALRDEIEPSWIGVGVDAPSAEPGGRKRALPEGAAVIVSVEGGSPADEAGLQIGDVVLGLPEQAFTRSWQFREWMMTAPRNAPNLLRVLRPGLGTEPDRELELTVFPRAEPPRKTPAGTWVVSPRAERRAP